MKSKLNQVHTVQLKVKTDLHGNLHEVYPDHSFKHINTPTPPSVAVACRIPVQVCTQDLLRCNSDNLSRHPWTNLSQLTQTFNVIITSSLSLTVNTDIRACPTPVFYSTAFLLTQACTIRNKERHHIYTAFVFFPPQLSFIPAPAHLCLSLALSFSNKLKQTELGSGTYLGLILIKLTHWSII